MNDLNALVQKISSDAAFRKELANSPEATLKKYGFTISPDVLATIKGMDEAGLSELAANYGSDKAAC
jgi:hypothetical protein